MKAHVVDLATYRRTGRIVERIPIQHTSFTIGDVRHQFASHYPVQVQSELDTRPQAIADALKAFSEAMAGRPCDSEPEGAA